MWKVMLNGRELVSGRDYELSADHDGLRLRLLGAYAKGEVTAHISWKNKTIEVRAQRDPIMGVIQSIDHQS